MQSSNATTRHPLYHFGAEIRREVHHYRHYDRRREVHIGVARGPKNDEELLVDEAQHTRSLFHLDRIFPHVRDVRRESRLRRLDEDRVDDKEADHAGRNDDRRQHAEAESQLLFQHYVCDQICGIGVFCKAAYHVHHVFIEERSEFALPAEQIVGEFENLRVRDAESRHNERHHQK